MSHTALPVPAPRGAEQWTIKAHQEGAIKNIEGRYNIIYATVINYIGIETDSLQWLNIFPLTPVIKDCFKWIVQRMAVNEYQSDLAGIRMRTLGTFVTTIRQKNTATLDDSIVDFCNRFIEKEELGNFDQVKMKQAIKNTRGANYVEQWNNFKNDCKPASASK
jgi:hypothetical protein